MSPTSVDDALGAARVVDGTLGDCDGLASVMSPLEPCEEQPAITVKTLRKMVSANRLTLAFPFFDQRKYTGLKAPV